MPKRDNKLKSNCCAREAVGGGLGMCVAFHAATSAASRLEHSQIIFNFSMNFYLTSVLFQRLLEHLFNVAFVSPLMPTIVRSLFDFASTQRT